MKIHFASFELNLSSKFEKTQFLDRFFDFFTKSPNLSQKSRFWLKNTSNFFDSQSIGFIPAVSDQKYARLEKKSIFGRKYRKNELLEPFFVFFSPCQGTISTVKRSF